MEDMTIQQRISALIDEEHKLRSAVQGGQISSADEQTRLAALEVELDQCWDVLRRRRAARDNHTDPDAVAPRSVAQVEGYEQ